MQNDTTGAQWRWNELESGRERVRREALKFFWSFPSTFLALHVQLVVLVSAFVMVSTVCMVSFLFAVFLNTVPPSQPFVKVGARAPPCPMESAPVQGPTLYVTITYSSTKKI